MKEPPDAVSEFMDVYLEPNPSLRDCIFWQLRRYGVPVRAVRVERRPRGHLILVAIVGGLRDAAFEMPQEETVVGVCHRIAKVYAESNKVYLKPPEPAPKPAPEPPARRFDFNV